ncbi:MarR family winged helix-turn-helix transcriptional regulator [Deinococcus pimensis]|uniref:MarR family winged helix-turn-helix transcriptional regulator n=1 Tax=Deinococcus pimensis TaxID=309888 RepID=UPI00048392B1|nr:MarR family transcriptional regulator [Deinococcus pimensis]
MTPRTPLPPAHLDAWKALLRTHATTVGRIEARLTATEHIPLVEYDVLLELHNAPEGNLRMNDLARRVLLSRSGLTRLVDRLERLGYLQRHTNPIDRRGTHATLTPAGRAALKAAWPVYAQGIQDAFARHLQPDEARHLTDLLNRVSAGDHHAS